MIAGRAAVIDTNLLVLKGDSIRGEYQEITESAVHACPIKPSDPMDKSFHALNTRPRKTIGLKTPAEAFDEHLQSVQQAGVASTG